MSSIERTAYPRFALGRMLKEHELEQFYSLTPDELRYINQYARTPLMRLNFAVQLKTFQRLGYFVEFKHVPGIIVDYIRKCLGQFNSPSVPGKVRQKYGKLKFMRAVRKPVLWQQEIRVEMI